MAIVALGVETVVCARHVEHTFGGVPYGVTPVLPWLASLFGAIWVACGACLLARRTRRTAALMLGGLLFLCTLILDAPKYAANPGNMSLRTTVFELLSLACLAWLIGGWLTVASHYLLALSLLVFGVDHFLALAFIGSLLPAWIPWHVFWVAFFGAAFIAAGLRSASIIGSVPARLESA